MTKKKLSAYHVIPAGETHALVLKWRDAKSRSKTKEDAVATAFRPSPRTSPWIPLGWNEGYEKLYGRQRMQMARDVSKRTASAGRRRRREYPPG